MRARTLATVLLGLGLAACGMFGSAEDAKLRKSPDFRSGYSDGCADANQQGADLRDRSVRDEALYKTNEAYRAGYSNGFSVCRTTNTPAGTQPGANPLSGPVPGPH